MMDKEFVPHELALELKQIGFDEPCLGYYIASTLFISNDTVYNSTDISVIKAPLFQQSFRWFRQEWAIHSWIRPNLVIDIPITYQFLINDDIDEDCYHIYEEAELACLKKLIELVKN